MSCTHASASRTYRATDQLSAGSATATMWWGTPSISSAVGAAVPTVMPRYICMESTDTTSPPKRCASATPIFVLPQAVGPTTQMTLLSMGLTSLLCTFFLRPPAGQSPPFTLS